MTPSIPGTPIILGGSEYIVPPLTFPQAQELERQLQLVLGPSFAGTPGAIKAYLEVIGTAIRRNYPDVTDEQLCPMIDFGNYIAVLRAAIGTPIAPVTPFMMPAPSGTLAN